MPDIAMCSSVTCTVRKTCHRNPESGTKPCEFRQSWFSNPSKCKYYWEIKQ